MPGVYKLPGDIVSGTFDQRLNVTKQVQEIHAPRNGESFMESKTCSVIRDRREG